MEIPLYQIFYEGEQPPATPPVALRSKSANDSWGADGDSARFLHLLRQLLARVSDQDRQILYHLASQLVRRSKP